MTPDELKTFCVDNAGKIATGKDKDGKERAGRLIAYTPSKSGGWILIEDTKLEMKVSLHTLPTMPYKVGRWEVVVPLCHLGIPCLADTVKLGEQAAPQVIASTPKPEPAKPKAKVERKCSHEECVEGYCYQRYAGFI